jgi:hypothetical protein
MNGEWREEDEEDYKKYLGSRT